MAQNLAHPQLERNVLSLNTKSESTDTDKQTKSLNLTPTIHGVVHRVVGVRIRLWNIGIRHWRTIAIAIAVVNGRWHAV